MASNNAIDALKEHMEQPWANSKGFLLSLVVLVSLGAVMGVVCAGFEYVVGDVTEKRITFVSGDEQDYPYGPSGKNLHGCPKWIFCCWGMGTVTGIAKVIMGLDVAPSLA